MPISKTGPPVPVFHAGIPIAGVLNVLLKVTVSCLCAVLSDKYMKDFKAPKLDAWWEVEGSNEAKFT